MVKNPQVTDSAPVIDSPYIVLPPKADIIVSVDGGSDSGNIVFAVINYLLETL